jgi:rhomboid family GlyGly-CTERM serine protease
VTGSTLASGAAEPIVAPSPGPGTALAAAAALALPALPASWPSHAARLELDREAVAAGELWRWLGCHWAHWSLDHLAWDLLAFVVLTVLAWRLGAARTIAALAAAAVAIPATVTALLPEVTAYRGLSGLDSALFVFVAIEVLRRGGRSGVPAGARWAAVLLVGFAAKVVFELVTGATLFADSASFAPVPLAHVVGGACGALATLRRRAPMRDGGR